MRKRKQYHHGNLREALLQAAIQLIAEAGPVGFTLREVARRAGVSHNAPYRHFQDKEALLAAVATEGFRELTKAMLGSVKAKSDAHERLKCAGLAYIDFALRRPEHFTVMFDVPVSRDNNPTLAEAGQQAFTTLTNFVRDCQEEGQFPPGDPLPFALLAWSMVHGISKLAIAKRLPLESKADTLKFARFVMDESLPHYKKTAAH